MPPRFLAALVLVFAALTGCSPTIRKPQLVGPGPAPVQRYNAQQFDPYPLPDLGPEIVGGRPPDYAVPVPEVERARQYRDSAAATSPTILVPQLPTYFPPTFPPATGPVMPPVEYRY